MPAAVTFTNPVGLLVLGLLGPLVALYVLRAERPRRLVSSVWLWRQAERDLQAARRFRRLALVVPLLLESLAVAALAVAAAEPARHGSLSAADAVAVVIDTSASMGASDGARTRLGRAKEKTKALFHAMGAHSTLVVEAAKEPHTASGIERDPERLGRIVDALSVRAEPGDLPAALVLAEERLARLPGTHRVVLVTDVNGAVPPRSRLPLEVVRVGAPADNAALTRFELRRPSAREPAQNRVEALVVVRSFAERATERFVTLSHRDGGVPLASRKVLLGPRERATLTLSFDASDADTGSGVVAELTPGDSLDLDDRAFAVVPPGARLPVVVAAAAQEEPWIVRALAADPDVELARAPLPLPDGAVPKGALLVVVGACVDSPTGGDVLVVAPPAGDCLGARVGAVVKAPLVTSWSDRDARLRFVSLDDIGLLEARAVDVPRAASLVRAGDTTVVADLGLFGRTGTLVSFDWGRSQWPLRASFVLFVRNITELARSDRARTLAVSAHTGEPLRVAAPIDGARASVRGPSGELPARLANGLVLAEAPSVPGFYDLVSGAKQTTTVAVNMADAGESDLRATPDANPGAAGASDPRSLPPALDSASPLFAALALAAMLAEVAWLSRQTHAPRAARTRKRHPGLAGLLLAEAAIAGYALAVAPHVTASPVSFERPAWLLVGVATLGGSYALVFRGAKVRALATTLLGLAGLSAALAASEPALRLGSDHLAVVVAVDRSRSIDLVPNATALVDGALARAARGMKGKDQLGVVAFASDAVLEEPLRTATEPRSPEHAALQRDGTDVAAAIRRALGETPGGSTARIVLVSDGVATRGDTMAAAAAAALAGVPVDVLPLLQAPRANVRVESVHAVPRATVGETMDLRVVVRSTTDTEGELFVLVDGEPQQNGAVKLHAGEDVLFLRAKADAPGLHEYAVRVTPRDPASNAIAEDDSQAAFVRVEGHARAVVIETDANRARPIQGALEAAAFDVKVVSATRAPASAPELLQSDLLVLGDVPARDLSPDQLEQISSYVEHLGGGMLLFGGKRTMGPGGYAGTAVEKVSPVSFELRNERRRARLAEVIAIDYSGSMAMAAGSHTKLELANEAAARSGELLGALDRLGVLHVDTTATWTVPLGPLGDKADVARKIRAVGPGGGGIYVDRALEVAYAALDRADVEQKHVLLFADGDDAEERRAAPSLARAAHQRNITTSVVALGRGQDVGGLEQLSREGQGRFYLIEDATRLPAVFAEETTIAAGSAVHDEPFRARVGAPIAATRGIDFSRAPVLGGYTVTRAKARAEVALLGVDDDPLLAVWAAGTGHAGAFTSDYAGPWGTEWRGWSEASRLFAQLARGLARGGDDGSVTLDATTSNGTFRITATAVAEDLARGAKQSFTASVVGPDGFVRATRLEPTSPGSYEALVPLGHAGTYVADVRDEATGKSVGTTGARLSAGDELEPTGTDGALLARIAALTGGRVRTTLDGVFGDRSTSRQGFRPLAAWLSSLAALAMLLAAAARRLPALRLPARVASTPASGGHAVPHVTGRNPAVLVIPETRAGDGGEPLEPANTEEPPDTGATPAGHPEDSGAPAAPPTTAELLLSRRRRRR